MLFKHSTPCRTRQKSVTGYNTLLLRLISGDLYSTCPDTKALHVTVSKDAISLIKASEPSEPKKILIIK